MNPQAVSIYLSAVEFLDLEQILHSVFRLLKGAEYADPSQAQ